jgi:hypothetical protein
MKAKYRLTLAIAVLAVLLVVAIGLLAVGHQDQRPGHCKSEARISAQPRDPSVLVGDQDRPTDRDNDEGRILQYEQAVALRQTCEQSSAPSRQIALQILVAALVFGVTVMGIILAHWTSVEERPTKRGRLVATFPDEDRTVFRIVNVGDSAAWLTAIGWTAKIGDRSDQKLTAVSRLVPKGGEDGADFVFDAAELRGGARFSILLRYQDAYREEWQAWRVFRMNSDRRVTVEKDGERPGDGDGKRHYGPFPLLIVLWTLSVLPLSL